MGRMSNKTFLSIYLQRRLGAYCTGGLVSHRVGDLTPTGVGSNIYRGLIPGPSNVASRYTQYAMAEHWRNSVQRGKKIKCSRKVSTAPCPPEIARVVAWYRILTSRCKYSCKSVSTHSCKTFSDKQFYLYRVFTNEWCSFKS